MDSDFGQFLALRCFVWIFSSTCTFLQCALCLWFLCWNDIVLAWVYASLSLWSTFRLSVEHNSNYYNQKKKKTNQKKEQKSGLCVSFWLHHWWNYTTGITVCNGQLPIILFRLACLRSTVWPVMPRRNHRKKVVCNDIFLWFTVVTM